MPIQQISNKKIYEAVTDELKQMIMEGQVKPGDKLDSVQALAEKFQVGRSAVREALSALQAMGLVDIKQGEGTFIRKFETSSLTAPLSTILMGSEDILELLEVRKILEVGSAGLAARKWEEDDLAALKQALDDMRAGTDSEEASEQADIDFHQAIAQASHNRLLIDMMKTISGAMTKSMRNTRKMWLFGERASTERLYEEHVLIYRAIRERDALMAQQRMLHHLLKVEDVLLNRLELGNDE
ncbi:FadR/GntR family transcriptional regulator [Brevibacillus borstelensis]|uniref:FadR/GntR family transcriptional regulator n=1 Tax=Brevibacillus borstelensis TaxID=45462 RepID=UPI000468087A|nr:FadR/GntR family transcriptional regulator [Brevibacillus borstelensis]MCC0563099.1 FadR family transcriptional regulator [Brevibacillus borstelensis]MED1742843.1 FadR/GntR family transcriptional regulator [Brevibacillus borstelensis]MED1853398.1 FadR/GntR family transcriptional regulator [Brevibacillus borstelensis]MED1881578.1 FadR/GntR family transcriptional regulator [Brevibacillus borstelensis]NOU57814.1 FadR family transcriptional regulator [Brevibacillus borstelensis]